MRIRAAAISSAIVLLVALSWSGHGVRGLDSGDRIDDTTFWRLFVDFSEPTGFFQSDNLVSNERTFPLILPDIVKRQSAASAYIGVGPEQNFTYIAALKPRIAFVVDIRRQNAMLHLLYKAVFEMSENRAKFLSRLFSRKPPRGLGRSAEVGELFRAFSVAAPEPERFADNLEEVRKRLVKTHRFRLGDDDLKGLRYVYTAFFEAGPDIQYTTGSGRRARPFPSLSELMTATDEAGIARSFLASEESYQSVREMQQRNLVIPIVGNFAGPKALKSVAGYVTARGLNVAVFYTSNVEMYLFRGDEWRDFYGNLTEMPADAGSVLVRSVFGRFGGGFFRFGGFPPPGVAGAGPISPSPTRLGTLQLDPMKDLVSRFRRGEISSYADVATRTEGSR